MKKIFFALIAVAFIGSLCFAQQSTMPISQPASTPKETKTLTGKVDSVSIADPKQKIPSEIVVVDDKGQKLSFRVRISTTIFDKDGNAITLNKIAKDSKVVIEYTVGQRGTIKAESIKVVKHEQ